MNYDGSNGNYEFGLDITNYFFTGMFIIECILKILAYGFRGYYHSPWNRFDFFVVLASISEIILADFGYITRSFLESFQVIRVLRVLRVLRFLRLVKIIKGLGRIVQTLYWSLSALGNATMASLSFSAASDFISSTNALASPFLLYDGSIKI